MERGEVGEIGIGGIGVAEGYLNRPDLTKAKFIDDFLALPNNPSGRIYRTGDLGRINQDGEIEFLGRLDTQIKLRGHRIELTEIEFVLLQIPEIAQAAAAIFEPSPGPPELVAYYSVEARLAGAQSRFDGRADAGAFADLHDPRLSRAPALPARSRQQQDGSGEIAAAKVAACALDRDPRPSDDAY